MRSAALAALPESERNDEHVARVLVVPALSSANDNKLAIIMRKHFEQARCVRPRLTARSTAELRLRFRSWRDAGITWAIIRGEGIEVVQRRAGHKLIATTQRYIVEAENRGATFGIPFPALPACLVPSSKLASKQTPPSDDRAENKPPVSAGGGSRTPDLARMKRPL
jgi:hypothetical protein